MTNEECGLQEGAFKIRGHPSDLFNLEHGVHCITIFLLIRFPFSVRTSFFVRRSNGQPMITEANKKKSIEKDGDSRRNRIYRQLSCGTVPRIGK
jgi:hypothetical protein